MKVKFEKIHADARDPFKATSGSAGFDLFVVRKEALDDTHIKYWTGIAVEIPAGYVGIVAPRSSVFKTRMVLSNGVGVIDSDYRGEISAVFVRNSRSKEYEVGDRCCQLVILPLLDVEFEECGQLSDTERGTGGYGSTGK